MSLPGPGDTRTWPVAVTHPNDPRQPDPRPCEGCGLEVDATADPTGITVWWGGCCEVCSSTVDVAELGGLVLCAACRDVPGADEIRDVA